MFKTLTVKRRLKAEKLNTHKGFSAIRPKCDAAEI